MASEYGGDANDYQLFIFCHQIVRGYSPVNDPQHIVATESEHDIALTAGALMAIAWAGKRAIIACTALGLVLAIAFLHLATPRYMAFLQLVPTEQSGVQVSRNIAGIASLAGINLPRGQASQFAFALETMKGRDVAIAIAKDQALMRRLFAKEWNPERRQWVKPADHFRAVKDSIKALLAMKISPWTPPGASELQDYLEKNLALAEDQKRSIATVTLTHPDPELARDVLTAVYHASDDHQRARMESRTVAYIDYIAKKLQTIQLAEHREALANTLAEQERMLMMVRTGQPFAADALGIVSVTDDPVFPKTFIVIAAGLAAGVLAGFGAAFLLHQRRLKSVAV